MSYILVKHNLRYLSEYRQRYALNLKLLMEFTGDSPTNFFRFIRHYSYKGSNIMFKKMLSDPNLPIDITLLHFLGISKRYNIPLDDLITTNLWQINYEKYFAMHKVARNSIRDYIKTNSHTVYNMRKMQKMLKSDSDDKTMKLILKERNLRPVKRGTSFDTVKMLKQIRTKNSDKKLRRKK